MFSGHFLALQQVPFQHAIKPISGAEMKQIALYNGLNQTMKRALSERQTNDSGIRYGV